MIDYKTMIKIELKYNIFKSLDNLKYSVDDDQILLLLNIHDYENLPDTIYEFIRFSRSWNRNYDFTAIYKNRNTDRFSYIHFNIIF